MMLGILLWLSINIDQSSQKYQPVFLQHFAEDLYPTRTFSGYVEYSENVLVLHHMPVGKYPHAVVYKHNLVVTNQKQKLILDKAFKEEKAVKVVGQIVNILGKQVILIDTIVILDFSTN